MPHVFDKITASLVSVGENSGTLTQELARIAEHLDKARELRTKILTALLYPVILVAGTLGVTVYMLFVLIPQLLPLFESLDVDLPFATKVVIAISEVLTSHGLLILVGSVAAVVAFVLLLRLARFRFAMERAILATPFIGDMYLKVQVAQFARIIGTLLAAGLTIVEAMAIAADSTPNLVYQAALREIAAEIQEGRSVSSYLAKHSALFPPFITQMIGVGEETGTLDDTFLFVAEFAEREVDDMTKVLATTLEPLLMIVMGGIVGFIAIAVITPIYRLTEGLTR
jgi:type IV pilus assembly protein PilC